MPEYVYYIIVAVVIGGLIPLVPKILNLRIWVLRKLHWNCLADWHERHFHRLVIIVRIILGVIAVVLLVLGFRGT